MTQINIEEACNILTCKCIVNEPSIAGNLDYQFQFLRSNLDSIQHVRCPLKLNDGKNRTTKNKKGHLIQKAKFILKFL